MLLYWVLTRDEGAVLNMADDYGSFQPSLGGQVVRTRAETWSSVCGAYANPNSDNTPKGTIEARWKFQDEVQPREDEIYAALRSGKLRSWVTCSETGDLISANPAEWIPRRFFSMNGHDLAVPPGDWGRRFEIAEYLGGDAPLPVPPTVWMDPVFSAEDAKKLWPAFRTDGEQVPEPVSVETAQGGQAADPEVEFVQWMKAEKTKYRTYPPRDRPDDRPGKPPPRAHWLKWAGDHGIRQNVVQDWVRKHKLSNPVGRPRK